MIDTELILEVAQKSEKDLRDLMKIPKEYKVLFLQGGASSQFSMVPINLLRGGSKANYANTGHWSVKAIAEAKRYCDVQICTDSSANNFTILMAFNIGILMMRPLISTLLPMKPLQA